MDKMEAAASESGGGFFSNPLGSLFGGLSDYVLKPLAQGVGAVTQFAGSTLGGLHEGIKPLIVGLQDEQEDAAPRAAVLAAARQDQAARSSQSVRPVSLLSSLGGGNTTLYLIGGGLLAALLLLKR